MVKEVEKYIDKIAPTSKLDAKLIVTLCDKYDLNVTFVLAQALIESHFGTRGKAAITNSVFNVGTFDNGEIRYRYFHPNESVEPFMQLLKKEYLVDKNLSDLIKDRGYTNVKGKRYATSEIYEESLRTMMLKINMETSIELYEQTLNLPNEQLLSLFGPSILLNEQIRDNLLQANLY